MQKAIIVKDSAEKIGFNKLNECLASGWKVVNSCAMPSSPAGSGTIDGSIPITPTCLVIIEKE
jgi:hypothetical protein